jgi:peptidoglycan/LPS O-acetylase OafA/YrhL
MSVTTATAARAERAAPAAGGSVRGVRRDIQGLRAVAVGAVVLFHVWPHRMPGGYVGVDVFFVISGFLISSHLLHSPPRTGRALGQFWARRARRLLPAALLVLLVTLALTRAFAPETQWGPTAREVAAAAFYVENWSLAGQALDYLAADSEPTAAQHFWSLSVEEQFYLVWPLLVAFAALLAARLRRRPDALVPVVFGAVLLVSMVLSIQLTASEPARAYFVTWTRAWEFAVGGLVAWAVLRSRRTGPAVLNHLLAWGGLAAITVACFAYSSRTAFPGYTALLPVLGTAAVLWARSEGGVGPGHLWRLPGVQWLGDVSYSVYLWHWPLLLLAPFVLDVRLSWPWKLLVLLVTGLAAHLSKVLVEDRFRVLRPHRGTARTYALAAAGMAVVTLVAGAQLLELDRRAAYDRQAVQRVEAARGPCFGAGSLLRGTGACPSHTQGEVVPALALAGQDKSDAYADACFVGAPYTKRLTCTYGDGPVQVALVGNSHAGHWLPALQRIADTRGWTITTYLVSVCNLSDAGTALSTAEQRRGCADYGRWVQEQTRGERYDLVISSERQSTSVPGHTWATTRAASAAGHRSYLQRWLDGGTTVLVLQDVVPPGDGVGRLPECLARYDDPARCSWPHDEPAPRDAGEYRFSDPLSDAARSLEGRVPVVSVDDLLCVEGTCLPVVGGVVTYFDASHLTATFARTLAPVLAARISAAVPGV